MPVYIRCPRCSLRLSRPGSRGRPRMTCPECGLEFNAPDTGDDDAPRRRKKADSSNVWIIAAVCGGLVLTGLIVAVVIVILNNQKSTPPNGEPARDGEPTGIPGFGRDRTDNTPVGPNRLGGPGVIPAGPRRPPLPAGWQDYRPPTGGYRVHLPAGTVWPGAGGTGKTRPGIATFEHSYHVVSDRLLCEMCLVLLPPDQAEATRQNFGAIAAAQLGVPPAGQPAQARVSWVGREAIEGVRMRNGAVGVDGRPRRVPETVRLMIIDSRVYVFGIAAADGALSDADKRAFFDSLVIER